ncbi:MAG: class I SAM-dependent methyltransferase [Acidobacteriales bacterium]|nr:class I SAM-dependent methyltransferase [Terriglobales bacterium]
MADAPKSAWSASYRLIAAEKWKAKSAAMGKPVTQALVEYADPQPGMKVLDLASGTGEPAISVASRVGAQGHVVALDLSAELLEIANQRASAPQLTNFETRQADVHDLPFAADTFDLVTCRFGVMFFADTQRSLSETLRVLKAVGRACFLAWGSFEQPYWQSSMAVVHKHVGGPLMDPGGADMFRFAEPGSLSMALASAGFEHIQEETRTLPWTWPGSPEEAWEYVQAVSSPFRPMLERVPEERWDQINGEIHAEMRKLMDGDQVNFGVRVILASGMKP